MDDLQRIVRSKSQKLLGAVETVLNLPVTLEKKLSVDGEGGTALDTARSLIKRKKSFRVEEEEFESKFTGEMISIEERIDECSLLSVLSCLQCRDLCSAPLYQCRKGHLYCPDCRSANQRTCRLCKQAVSRQDDPALDRLLSLIALPCKYSSRGCFDVFQLNMKQSHELKCRLRPVTCQYSNRGCSEILSFKDIANHQKYCKSKHAPLKYVPRQGIVDPLDIIVECCDKNLHESGKVASETSTH